MRLSTQISKGRQAYRRSSLKYGVLEGCKVEGERLEVQPVKPSIPLNVLNKVDIRVGTIEQVGNVLGTPRNLSDLPLTLEITKEEFWPA